MKINLKNAVKLFFPNPSLEMVYFEAVVNSIDQGATEIDILISIAAFSKPETLVIKVSDNGTGFTDRNFDKFSQLLEIEEEDHKGVGRLVFLNYFSEIEATSYYDTTKSRQFSFNERFDGKSKVQEVNKTDRNTSLLFTRYKLEKIKSYDYLKPSSIKKSLMLHFFPLFYMMRLDGKELRIKISLQTDEANRQYEFYADTKEIIISKIPTLQKVELEATGISLFEKLDLYYLIKQNIQEPSSIIAISVDNRTFPIDMISKAGMPAGYEIIFLLYSSLFTGKTNTSRQELSLDDSTFKTVKKIFSDKVTELLDAQIPLIKEQNTNTTTALEETFPHLQGYFENSGVGLMDKNQAIDTAQKKFFAAQKEILECQTMTEEQYQKSLVISSRVLTEYVLYRNVIIQKLKKMDRGNPESDIHNIIVPMKSKFYKKDSVSHLYTNNAWLLDDKYMSYNTIFSDREMNEIIKSISFESEDVSKDESRPDIAIVFSNDPDKAEKVDVVVVELKRLGLGLANKENAESQLRQRARRLLKLYPDKIQRIWFYAVVDFDREFKNSLKEMEYTELFSAGTVLYKEQKIIINDEKDIRVPVGIYILSYKAFLDDAEIRNGTFLSLLKDSLKGQVTI
jgi:hypothetical protein